MDLDRLAPLFIVAAWVWIGGWVAASVIYRRQAGKPILPRPPLDALYVDTRASGASQRSALTRMGGASRVLIVAVTPTRLVVRPRFPFNLMFLPEIYGLEYDVPRADVLDVQPRRSWRGQTLLLTLRVGERQEGVELQVREPAAFLAALTRA